MKEGQDYSILPNGLLVFSREYLLIRGYCCGNGCINCPYEYINVPDERQKSILHKRQVNENKG